MNKLALILSFVFICPAYSAEPSKAFVELAKKVRKGVVNISIIQKGSKSVVELFPGYFVPYDQPDMKGAGSGFIIDKTGLIITNAHVVKGSNEIQVQFIDEENLYPAKVLGFDTRSDIALLKVDVKKRLQPISLGNSSKLEVGEWVAAIGNPHGYGHTMTKGIISAIKREIDDLNMYPLLQTDASINPGNSGGPLINLNGEVVGVNQAIVRGAAGISFAIPINNVIEVIEDLKTYGYVRKTYIGVHFTPYSPKSYGSRKLGVLVENVVVESPAQKAGIKIGDQIISFNGKKINRPTDLPKLVRKSTAGKIVNLKILREGKTLKLTIVPAVIEGDKKQALAPQKKENLQGLKVLGGFQVAEATSFNLNRYKHPGWLKHPIIVKVKKGSLAFKAGLKEGDMVYQMNESKVLRAADVKKTFKKGKSYSLNVLRYDQSSYRYRIATINLKL